METVELSVELSSAFWDAAPKFRVFINNTIIHEGVASGQTTVKWSGELSEGKNVLAIELYDKDKNQTVLENGIIIKDQLLNIDEITFDEINIGYLKHSLSNYYPDQNYYSNTVPDNVKHCVNMGFNGRWELEFTCPIYIWLLENV